MRRSGYDQPLPAWSGANGLDMRRGLGDDEILASLGSPMFGQPMDRPRTSMGFGLPDEPSRPRTMVGPRAIGPARDYPVSGDYHATMGMRDRYASALSSSNESDMGMDVGRPSARYTTAPRPPYRPPTPEAPPRRPPAITFARQTDDITTRTRGMSIGSPPPQPYDLYSSAPAPRSRPPYTGLPTPGPSPSAPRQTRGFAIPDPYVVPDPYAAPYGSFSPPAPSSRYAPASSAPSQPARFDQPSLYGGRATMQHPTYPSPSPLSTAPPDSPTTSRRRAKFEAYGSDDEGESVPQAQAFRAAEAARVQVQKAARRASIAGPPPTFTGRGALGSPGPSSASYGAPAMSQRSASDGAGRTSSGCMYSGRAGLYDDDLRPTLPTYGRPAQTPTTQYRPVHALDQPQQPGPAPRGRDWRGEPVFDQPIERQPRQSDPWAPRGQHDPVSQLGGRFDSMSVDPPRAQSGYGVTGPTMTRNGGYEDERRTAVERRPERNASQWALPPDRSPGRAGPVVGVDRSFARPELAQPDRRASTIVPSRWSPREGPTMDVRRSPSMSSAPSPGRPASSGASGFTSVADLVVPQTDWRSVDPRASSLAPYGSVTQSYGAPTRPQPMPRAPPSPLALPRTHHSPPTPRPLHADSFPPFTGDPSPLFDHRHDFDACVSPRIGGYPDFERPIDHARRPTYDGGSVSSGGTRASWSLSPPSLGPHGSLGRGSAFAQPFHDPPVAQTRPSSRDRRSDFDYGLEPPTRSRDNPWAEPEPASRWASPTGPVSPRAVGGYSSSTRSIYDPGYASAMGYGFPSQR